MQNKKSFYAAMKWQKVTILVCVLAIFSALPAKLFAQEEQAEIAQNEGQAELEADAVAEQSDLEQASESEVVTETQAVPELSTDEADPVQITESEAIEQQEQTAPQAAPRRRPQSGQVVTLSSTIVGNQEQPQVLYIVPWKPVGDSDLENQNIQSQLDIIFGHVERVELRRELLYMEEFSKTEDDSPSN